MLPEIKQNVSLKDYSTMRLGGTTAYLCDIELANQIPAAIAWADQQNLPYIMIGGGSNVIWKDEGFAGLVMINKINGYELQDHGDQQYLVVGSGENWDSVVQRSVEAGLSGIEQLSLIPGSVGATPVQNVGAYGREVKDVLVSVQAYSVEQKKMVAMMNSDCEFGYRTSRFKTKDKGKYFITSVTFELTKSAPNPPFYSAVEDYLKQNKVSEITASTIRDAVIAIRSAKLPDPAVVANCGSFFHNPIVPMSEVTRIKSDYPNLIYWPVEDGKGKIPAGWLLEQLGLKGYHEPNTGMAIWHKQALVFVNEKAASTNQLIAFRDAILRAVQDKFGITLVQEPEIVET